MEIVLIICGSLCLIAGFIGCLLPIIPGVPLAWAGLLLVYFVEGSELSLRLLIICAVVTVAVTVLDNIAPIWFTKKTGGTKAGIIGSTAGLLVGFFFGPVGIIICPFLGAFVGELIHDRNDAPKALKSAWGAFLGFVCGTGVKMVTCAVFIWIFITALI